jgi:hypothetical protein
VLFESTSDIRLFVPPTVHADPSFDQCGEFEQAKYFANCKEGRRLLTYWLQPPALAAPGALPKNVAVLTGQPRSGKSHLLKWCMESWALAEAEVRYIQIHGGQSKTFLSILRQIRSGDSDGTDETSLLHGPLNPEAFRRFNWELKNYIDTGQAGDWTAAEHGHLDVADDERQLGANGEKRLESKVCASFLDALKLAAGAAPLILVFDRFVGPAGERLLPVDEFAHLVKHVFRPIAVDPASNVKLVFVVNQGQQVEFKLNGLPPENVLDWSLPVNYSREEYAKLAAEMLWLENSAQEAVLKQLTEALLDFPAAPDAPQGLAFLQQIQMALEQRNKDLLARVGRMR